MDSFKELAQVAEQLNQKSNQINLTISSINDKFRAMNLGTEVWLEDRPLISGDDQLWRLASLTGEDSEPTDVSEEDGETFHTSNQTWLGYCKVENLWQLAVRNQEVLPPGVRALDGKHIVDITLPVPLLKATRDLRLEALELLPMLVEKMKNRAEQLIAGIEKASALAAKL